MIKYEKSNSNDDNLVTINNSSIEKISFYNISFEHTKNGSCSDDYFAFNFQKNIRVVEEQWALKPNETIPNKIMAEKKPMWSSTAFWYSAKATGAESMK